MPKRPTSADVAAAAGVSRTTVSFVLNEREGVKIPDETRQRVLAAAAKLDYHPNSVARQLAGGASRALGLVLRQTPEQVANDGVLAETLRGLSDAARAANHRVLVETLAPAETGWLAGLRDPVVGLALAALHGAPRESWTVEGLARNVGVSRSVLAERFTAMVGQPPMQYLALWRMQLASRLLIEGGQVAAVSAAAGYASEAAFSRAFKKLVGQAPAAWRRGARPEREAANLRLLGEPSPGQE